MAISSLAGSLESRKLALDSQVSQHRIAAGCKRSACGRAVYRITYPVRQLISVLLMAPPLWTRDAVRSTWTALENRQCNPVIKLALSVAIGVCALAAGLTLGVVALVTVGLVIYVGRAICEPDIDKLDTLLERSIRFGLIQSMEA